MSGTSEPAEGADIPDAIDCVDCGGRCHLLGSHGGLATYRCSDCNDRWDVLFGDEGEESRHGD